MTEPQPAQQSDASQPPHPTCIETTNHEQAARGERAWVCSRDCPSTPSAGQEAED